MSNPFSNVCTSVEAYSFNKSYTRKIDTMSDSAAANSTLRKMKALEQESIMESNMLKAEADYYKNKRNEGIVNRYIKESQIPININRINNEAKEFALKDILFEVFYNSLLMDDDFLEENCHHIKCLTDKYVDENGGFKVLDNAIKNNMDNMLLKKIKSVCEAVAKEVCDRKLKDSKECKNMDLIDFDMTSDEKDMLDYSKKDNLNIDRISELVKDKVLTVVKDEKTRSEEAARKQEDIVAALQQDTEADTEEKLNEALNNIILNKPIVESGTLFDTLFRDCYQEYITENVSIVATDMKNIEDDKEVARNYDTEMDIDDALTDEKPVEDTEVNMDLILTEALTKYTLMEMLYTMGFENYSYENIKKLTENMLNPVTNTVDTVIETEEFAKNRSEFFGIFNKLKDDPSNETHRTKMSEFMTKKCKDKAVKNECKGFVTISKKQIDSIIEKNPKMKDKYTDLSNFMDTVIGD